MEWSFVATTKTRSDVSMSDSFAVSPFSRTLVSSLSAYVSTKPSLLFTVSEVLLTFSTPPRWKAITRCCSPAESHLTVQCARDESQVPAYETVAESVLISLVSRPSRGCLRRAARLCRARGCRRIVRWSVRVRDSRADAPDQSNGADTDGDPLRKLLHAMLLPDFLTDFDWLPSLGWVRRTAGLTTDGPSATLQLESLSQRY